MDPNKLVFTSHLPSEVEMQEILKMRFSALKISVNLVCVGGGGAAAGNSAFEQRKQGFAKCCSGNKFFSAHRSWAQLVLVFAFSGRKIPNGINFT